MLTAIFWNPLSLVLLLICIAGIALFEYMSIFRQRGYNPMPWAGYIIGLIILTPIFLVNQKYIEGKYLYLIILPVFALFFSFIFVKKENYLQSIMVTVFGLLYIVMPISVIPFISQNSLTEFRYNPEILIGVLFIIWTFDTGAYISGILFGKHKMAPSISPKKSWEGFFGGMVFAILVAYIYARFTSLLTITDWIILSIIIVLAGTTGDLFESLIKREAGIKDSGKIMPGHGGILDRFDSLLLITPFVFLYIYIIKI
jgi:phosphatidate cytidylyltransferase